MGSAGLSWLPAAGRALVTIDEEGRREWSFPEVRAYAERVAWELHEAGARRGDVVLVLIGNRIEWVTTMLACFEQGFVVLPCNEQLRAKDLALRFAVTRPAVVVAHERNRALVDEAGWEGAVLTCPWNFDIPSHDRPSCRAIARCEGRSPLGDDDPLLITFTSGTAGEPKAAVHGRRYIEGQRLQAAHWLAPEPGDLVWCTAASGWSKSARNSFIAPWLSGAAALLVDRRFDPAERLNIVEAEGVNVLCMAPTEYRVIAKRVGVRALPSLRGLVAAGEALNPEVLRAWHEATGLWIRDGYGQTETGQLTGYGPGEEPRPGSMGRALPGIDLRVEDGELVLADPSSDPTFFLGYLAASTGMDPVLASPTQREGPWHTGDRVTVDADGYLYFEGRTDDVIISAGYRIGPFEVESALVAHPAVAEAAVVAAPDDERGSVVRAVVVLRDGFAESPELASEMQEWVKEQTAPYKYPRVVDFAAELPKTASGKIRRAALRDG